MTNLANKSDRVRFRCEACEMAEADAGGCPGKSRANPGSTAAAVLSLSIGNFNVFLRDISRI